MQRKDETHLLSQKSSRHSKLSWGCGEGDSSEEKLRPCHCWTDIVIEDEAGISLLAAQCHYWAHWEVDWGVWLISSWWRVAWEIPVGALIIQCQRHKKSRLSTTRKRSSSRRNAMKLSASILSDSHKENSGLLWKRKTSPWKWGRECCCHSLQLICVNHL